MRRLHHVQISIPAGGESDARSFYATTVGLAEIPKPEHLRSRGGLWFRLDSGLELHLGSDIGFRPSAKAHVAIEVDDLGALRGRLEAAGVRVWEDQPLPGFDRFYAADPFGNRLEFLARPRGERTTAGTDPR